MAFGKKRLGRREGSCRHAGRANEARQRLPHGIVVVNDKHRRGASRGSFEGQLRHGLLSRRISAVSSSSSPRLFYHLPCINTKRRAANRPALGDGHSRYLGLLLGGLPDIRTLGALGLLLAHIRALGALDGRGGATWRSSWWPSSHPAPRCPWAPACGRLGPPSPWAAPWRSRRRGGLLGGLPDIRPLGALGSCLRTSGPSVPLTAGAGAWVESPAPRRSP